ncbi:hypothetical protein C8R45DRAFT_997377 [Mycena sanguinolenta]|nr:hypothetical protein C8R45DRAFT_997377 [Mycena sanguinolenta]
MSYRSVNHPCAVCGRATSLWCSRCQNAWYCSPDHMRNDWPQHRSNCHPPSQAYNSNMIATPPPAEPEYTSVEAILFSANEGACAWIAKRAHADVSQTGSTSVCPLPSLQPYIDAPPEGIVLTHGLNGEPLRFPLHIFYSRSALTRASPINRSIYHITSGAASKPWYGNVIALKFNGARRQGYTDAGNNDLPALSAYFLSYQ